MISYNYDAWGNYNIVYHTDTTPSAVVYNPFRYRGYYFDRDLSLYYVNTRYYDAQIGRWINADSSVSAGQGLNGYNMFLYGGNNPVQTRYISAGGTSKASMTMPGASSFSSYSSGASSTSTRTSIEFPGINLLALGIDFVTSGSGAVRALSWLKKNPEFDDFLYSAYGISKSTILQNLNTPIKNVGTVLGIGFVAYDTCSAFLSHINSGNSLEQAAASGLVTAGAGAFNIWASAKIGAYVGSAISGGYGFWIGWGAGLITSVVIDGILYTEIDGMSLAECIEADIQAFLEYYF